jgi:hypothetical protein
MYTLLQSSPALTRTNKESFPYIENIKKIVFSQPQIEINIEKHPKTSRNFGYSSMQQSSMSMIS